MSIKLAEAPLWQQTLASLIRSGLLLRADVSEAQGLFTVVGIYGDGSCSAALAKYADRRRASDAADVVNRMAETVQAVLAN